VVAHAEALAKVLLRGANEAVASVKSGHPGLELLERWRDEAARLIDEGAAILASDDENRNGNADSAVARLSKALRRFTAAHVRANQVTEAVFPSPDSFETLVAPAAGK
jgi:hypothetical protein